MRHMALMLASAACASSLMLCSMSAADDGFEPSGGGGGSANPNAEIKIKIPKDNGKSESTIRGSVNGQPYAVAVDQEVTVPAAVAQAIGNSGIKFEVVDGEGAGLPPSSTAPLTDTASRETPAVDPLQQPSGSDAMQPVPTLEGGDGDSGHGAGSAEPAAQGRDLTEGQQNADGQGVAATGGPRVGNDTSDKASSDAGQQQGAGDQQSTDRRPDADKVQGGDQQDEGDQPETVEQLKDRIAGMNDVDALKREHDAESAGRKRTTALAAIDARIDAVQSAQ